MFHISFIFLSFILSIITMTMANPCPCDAIVSESLPNNPPNSITDPTINDFLEDYFDRLTAASQLDTSRELYPLFRQTKSLDLTSRRNKRPSWAAVGKRTAPFNSKQPSWASIG